MLHTLALYSNVTHLASVPTQYPTQSQHRTTTVANQQNLPLWGPSLTPTLQQSYTSASYSNKPPLFANSLTGVFSNKYMEPKCGTLLRRRLNRACYDSHPRAPVPYHPHTYTFPIFPTCRMAKQRKPRPPQLCHRLKHCPIHVCICGSCPRCRQHPP